MLGHLDKGGTMTATPYPIPRETRETTVLVGNGTPGPYGPTTFKVFDIADVVVWARAEEETVFADVTDDVTIAKTANLGLDTVSVTFAGSIPATTEFVIQSRRTAERSLAITKGGTLDTAQLEKELSKLAAAMAELRRDVDRAVRPDIGAAAQILPPPVGGRYLAWNSAATKLENRTLVASADVTEITADDLLFRRAPGERLVPVAKVIREGRTSAFDLGLPSDNPANMAPGLETALGHHGAIWVPECNINLPEQVAVTLYNHVDVEFHPKTKIIAGQDLNTANLILLTPPAGGIGIVPTERITFRVTRLNVDSSGMVNPTSIPFNVAYPPNAERPGVVTPGGSNTVFSPLGTFESGGRKYNGFARVEVLQPRIWAGAHWRTAGGDSMIGAGEGVDVFVVDGGDFYGPRDTAIYCLPAGEGEANHPRCRVIVRNCRVHNGMGLVSAKRSAELVAEYNEGFNSVGVIGVSGSAIDAPVIGPIIRGNMGYNCMRVAEVVMAQGATIEDNYCENFGALLDNGERVINIYSENYPFVFNGVENSVVRNNRARGKEKTKWSGQTVKLISAGATLNADNELVKTEKTTFAGNVALKDYVNGYDYAGLGREEVNECEDNIWDGNRVEGGGTQLLDTIDATSKWIPPRTGMSYTYEDVTPATPHTGTTSPTVKKTRQVLGAEIPVGMSFTVETEAVVGVGANGSKELAVNINNVPFVLSQQTTGQAQDMGGRLTVKRTSSTGYTVTGTRFEEGGTSDVVPGKIEGIGSGNFNVEVVVTLGHVDDSVTVQNLVIKPVV
jgi:hypothetical protein